jgi:hypothetical protein
MTAVHPVYKILFLSSLWVSLSSIFEITTIETTTVTTTTKKYRINTGFTEEILNKPTITRTSKYSVDDTGNDKRIVVVKGLSEIGNHIADERSSQRIGENVATESPTYSASITSTSNNTSTVNRSTAIGSIKERGLFRNCTSPEASVPWPFHREHGSLPKSSFPIASSALNPQLKCGLGLDGNRSDDENKVGFIEYFERTVKQELIQPLLDQENCHDLVVFGAAFGSSYVQFMVDQLQETDDGFDFIVDSDGLMEKHGRCFFMFVNFDETEEEKPEKLGHYWLIPLRPDSLPYENARRNTKLLKYMGQYAFLNHNHVGTVSPKVIIWQDAKFFREDMVNSIPRDYSTVVRPRNHDGSADANAKLPCLSTMGLPAVKASFGKAITDNFSNGLTVSSYGRPRYQDHCQTIIDALQSRPGVTDSPHALRAQCQMYMKFVNGKQERETIGNEEEMDSLNFGLIDSAFLVWNESTQQCRDFNAILRCTMLDQLQCHSDRDQVLFPFVIHQLLVASDGTMNTTKDSSYALKATYYNSRTESKSNIDRNWKPHAHDLDLVESNSAISSSIDANVDQMEQQVYVRMKRSACHWYYFGFAPNQPMGERFCGHKIWLRDNLKKRNPSLEQEKQIAVWSDLSSTEDANATSLALASKRGNRDLIDVPFAADFHRCTSPEFGKVPWAFQDRNDDLARRLSCGTHNETLSPFHRKLKKTVLDRKIRSLANEEKCSDMVVFSVAFQEDITRVLSILEGEQDSDDMRNYKERQKEMQLNHGNCFFLFVVEQNLSTGWKTMNSTLKLMPSIRGAQDRSEATSKVSTAGQYLVIPIDRDILPYESMHRNSKLLQYNGQLFFPDAKNVVYQDITFFDMRYLKRHPTDYSTLFPPRSKVSDVGPAPCLTVFSLPKSKATVGSTSLRRDEEFFQGHCKHLINSLEELAPDGTMTGVSIEPALTASLIQQCDAYLQYVYKRELDTDILNQAMVDTSFMTWNEGTEFCRDFNAQLRCSILDQLHCHSESDRIAFPFALYVNQMGLGSTTEFEYVEDDGRITRWPVDSFFQKKDHQLNFFRETKGENSWQDVVRVVREKLHWARNKSGGYRLPR